MRMMITIWAGLALLICAGDSNGFVSKLSPDGEILVLKFMVGTDERPLHGGRGMFIDQFGLWVVDAGGHRD